MFAVRKNLLAFVFAINQTFIRYTIYWIKLILLN